LYGANAAVNITLALNNSVVAATNDRDSVAQLTNVNQQLIAAVKTLTEQLKQALATNAVLAGKIGQGTTPTNHIRQKTHLTGQHGKPALIPMVIAGHMATK
jgi:hypothetical protein